MLTHTLIQKCGRGEAINLLRIPVHPCQFSWSVAYDVEMCCSLTYLCSYVAFMMAIMYLHDHHTVFRKEFIDSNDSHFSDSNSPLWFCLLSDSINDSLRKPSTDVNTAYGKMLTEQDIIKIIWFLFLWNRNKMSSQFPRLHITPHRFNNLTTRSELLSLSPIYIFSFQNSIWCQRRGEQISGEVNGWSLGSLAASARFQKRGAEEQSYTDLKLQMAIPTA